MTVTEVRSDDDLLAWCEEDWMRWLVLMFPQLVDAPFGPHHEEFWRWVWAIKPRERPQPFVGIWARGGAKSTSAEASVVALAARGIRRYGLYICSTQDLADKHIDSIGSLLESETVEQYFPALGEREVGKYGNSKGWRRNRLRTSSGFTLDALGLDTAGRGIKVDDVRPDLMVLDDLDEAEDGPAQTERKLSRLTKSILPAGTDHTAVVAIQNLIHRDGIFGRLAGVAPHKADFLADRIVSGPIPAVTQLEVEERNGRWVIVGGTPTWAGQDLEACQSIIDSEGITAFRSERQHEVQDPDGGMWGRDFPFRHCNPEEVPDLVKTAVWVDPAVTDTDKSDSMGIQADGLAQDGTIFRLWSWEARTSPEDALCRAIRKALEVGALYVGVETDQGGDTWTSVFKAACDTVRRERSEAGEPMVAMPGFRYEKAGQGHGPKVHRASQMLAAYETMPGFVHVRGTHEILERALHRFPLAKPYDLTDAAYWGWWDLMGRNGPVSTVAPVMVGRSEPGWSEPSMGNTAVTRQGRQLIGSGASAGPNGATRWSL